MKSSFDDLSYIDPFEYKGIIYPTVNHAYFASKISNKKALLIFLKSSLDPRETLSIIKDEFKRNEFDDLMQIMRARFLRNENSIRNLLRTKPKDKWVRHLRASVESYSFSQQELFENEDISL